MIPFVAVIPSSPIPRMRINSVLPTALLVAALVAPSFAGAQAAGANPKPPRKPAPSSVAAKASVPSAAHTAAVDPVAKGMEKSDGKAVKGAKRAAAAKSISATCNDGSSYMGATRSGACSRHGGVKGWADGSAAGNGYR